MRSSLFDLDESRPNTLVLVFFLTILIPSLVSSITRSLIS
nr:MAG TPA: hypothetical protein [Caudoviricetes sp.]